MTAKRNKTGLPYSMVLLASTVAGSVAIADQASLDEGFLEEVVVTASKREASLLDLPQSIQAISGADVEELSLSGVEDITALVPNLNLNEGRKSGGGFNIRGIAALSEQFSQFSTVGLYLDETPISDGFANFDIALFDLERIEVLKGPQGTLYGEGSLGGTIRLITEKPVVDELSAKLLAGLEDTKEGDLSYRVGVAANIPLVDEIAALRITGSHNTEGGFMEATAGPGSPVQKDVNGSKSNYLKVALALEPTENLRINPNFIYQDREVDAGTTDAIGLPELTGFANGPDTIDEELKIYSLDISYDMEWGEVVSSTSFSDREVASLDDDVLTNAILSAIIAPSPVTTQVFDRSIETFTQEVRLVSNGSEKLDWLTGFFYRDREYGETVDIRNPLVGLISAGDTRVFTQDNSADYKQIAAFGEINYRLLDNLTLTAGARWFEEEIDSDLDFGTFSVITFGFETVRRAPSIKENDTLFKLAASYEPNDDTLVYALFSQGVRPGGVNDRVLDLLGLLTPAEEDALTTFLSDSTDNYEVGLKQKLLGGRVSLTTAAFFIDWKDIQLDRENSAVPGPVFTVNAGEAESVGLELELTAAPTDALNVGVFLGYNEAEISKQTETAAGVIPDGADLPFAPNFSGNVFAEYSFKAGGNAGLFRIDWHHTGKRKSKIDIVGDAGLELASYRTLDVKLAMDFGGWSASLYGKNVTNELAELDAILFNDGLVGNSLASYVRNRPRVFGVQLQAHF